jgi:hypothetical protein
VVRIVRAETDSTQFHPIYAMRTDAATGTLDALGALDDVDAVLLLGTGLTRCRRARPALVPEKFFFRFPIRQTLTLSVTSRVDVLSCMPRRCRV